MYSFCFVFCTPSNYNCTRMHTLQKRNHKPNCIVAPDPEVSNENTDTDSFATRSNESAAGGDVKVMLALYLLKDEGSTKYAYLFTACISACKRKPWKTLNVQTRTPGDSPLPHIAGILRSSQGEMFTIVPTAQMNLPFSYCPSEFSGLTIAAYEHEIFFFRK